MQKFSDHIRLKESEFSSILRDYAQTAVDSKSVRELVKIAKIRLDLVTTNVTNGNGKELAYPDDFQHVSKALNALEHATIINKELYIISIKGVK